ncbi:endonuclease/exonuclease/phosphatase family protein [uncultured Erythrobacter sp.]|uniref:endonuclease/exonuclease/phosphatase family protein n=1 Tax=uncultured Erythrobacter sp. TaxID=263913 RepID=UPI0026337B8E|nr:endonuclease/exonuclease/phosphatase family protein [uncultured Erythrobacter sp.]
MPFYHGLKTYDHTGDADFPHYPGKKQWIAGRLLNLRKDLDEAIVSRRKPRSLIVGSWNIRAFDDGLPRLDESYHYIAEIIGAFDICAIQEIKGDLEPLKRLVKLLGPNWDYFASDVSTHKGGNGERMAFVYNTNRVFFRNLVGEIVLDPDDLGNAAQFARSPFFASFQAGWFRFCLCSTHIFFGGTDAQKKQMRKDEIRELSEILVKRAKKEDQVYILLGDMNIEKENGPIMQALLDSKMEVPLFGATNLKGDKHYDQMAYTVKGKAENKTRLIRRGSFDWRKSVFGPYPQAEYDALPDEEKQGLTRRLSHAEMLAHYKPICDLQRTTAEKPKEPYKDFAKSYGGWTTFEMSDHLPIWMELEVDYSDDYIARFLEEE